MVFSVIILSIVSCAVTRSHTLPLQTVPSFSDTVCRLSINSSLSRIYCPISSSKNTTLNLFPFLLIHFLIISANSSILRLSFGFLARLIASSSVKYPFSLATLTKASYFNVIKSLYSSQVLSG